MKARLAKNDNRSSHIVQNEITRSLAKLIKDICERSEIEPAIIKEYLKCALSVAKTYGGISSLQKEDFKQYLCDEITELRSQIASPEDKDIIRQTVQQELKDGKIVNIIRQISGKFQLESKESGRYTDREESTLNQKTKIELEKYDKDLTKPVGGYRFKKLSSEVIDAAFAIISNQSVEVCQ